LATSSGDPPVNSGKVGGGFGGGSFLLHGLGGEEGKEGKGFLVGLREAGEGEGSQVSWRRRWGRQGRVVLLLCAHDTHSVSRTDSLWGRYIPSIRCGQKLLSFLQSKLDLPSLQKFHKNLC
jgi:hypothetical protein